MANDSGHGGYRRPSRPAAVSGPGAHSQRTDGRPKMMDLPDAQYGEAQNFEQIQQGAPLSAPSGSAGGSAPAPVAQPTGLGAASEFPDQPVTAGAAMGPGPGMDVLGLPDGSDEVADLRRRYGPLLPYFIRKADSPYASQEFKNQVRYLVSKIG